MGSHVNVSHPAAPPIGMTVSFSCEVTAVNDRRIEIRVEARDEKERVGEGTHERTAVKVAKFATRLAAKKQDAQAG